MNTLLRKAAERGGVHPFHIDRVSSAIAIKIESMSSIAQTQELMTEIFCAYCELVREKSMKELPPIVKQTVMIIESDLSADLSPSLLASHQGVSLGYLSSIFKKATNQTISEYVRQKRMEYAAYLLRNTNLQVQTVALHNGIMDVQYFSKLFKRQIGMTPTEYRLSKKG
jgi:YesN/AraC family two-component response regulator